MCTNKNTLQRLINMSSLLFSQQDWSKILRFKIQKQYTGTYLSLTQRVLLFKMFLLYVLIGCRICHYQVSSHVWTLGLASRSATMVVGHFTIRCLCVCIVRYWLYLKVNCISVNFPMILLISGLLAMKLIDVEVFRTEIYHWITTTLKIAPECCHLDIFIF